MNAREIALKTLYRVNEEGAFLNAALDKSLESSGLKPVDKAFVSELVHGVVRWKLTLDYIIEKFSRMRMDKISPWILNILRLGIYQVIYIEKVPVFAACDESVKLARRYGHAGSGGFVNGILRNVVRSKDNIDYPDKTVDEVRHLSVKHSFPEWMVKRWLGRYGFEFTSGLLRASNEPADASVLVNVLKISKESLKKRLSREGISHRDGRYVKDALILEDAGSVSGIREFNEGWFQVQDESSMLVGYILAPEENEFVIDVCAAPGGKAVHIAQLMKNRGLVAARDIREQKVKLIRESADRLGIDIIRTEVRDALVPDEGLYGRADRVLVDAPCTGLGVIRKKPDIKWRRTEEQVEELSGLQRKMLDVCGRYVKKGGTLVYSTCTTEPEENTEVLNAFLAGNPGFSPVDFSDLLPAGIWKETAASGFIQLYPHIDGVDGFFIARLRRNF